MVHYLIAADWWPATSRQAARSSRRNCGDQLTYLPTLPIQSSAAQMPPREAWEHFVDPQPD